MGRVRVPGLNIDLSHLQQEVLTFYELIRNPHWMTEENFKKRRSVCDGLTFLVLNLSSNADKSEAWNLFHEAMDEYHAKCDELNIHP